MFCGGWYSLDKVGPVPGCAWLHSEAVRVVQSQVRGHSPGLSQPEPDFPLRPHHQAWETGLTVKGAFSEQVGLKPTLSAQAKWNL